MIVRMIDAALTYELDTIVDVSLRSRLEPVQEIDRLIEFHVHQGGGYTEPYGWKPTLLPRVIDFSTLENVRKISDIWPYYGIIQAENLKVNHYRAPLDRLFTNFIEKLNPLHLALTHVRIGKLLRDESDDPGNPCAWISRARSLIEQIISYGLDPTDCTLLEIGCGQRFGLGILLHLLGIRHYTGVDICPIMINRMDVELFCDFLMESQSSMPDLPLMELGGRIRYHRKRGEHSFLDGDVRLMEQVDAASLPFKNESYDVIFSDAVLEHVAHPEAVIKEMDRVLKPGGLLFHLIDFKDHHPDGSGVRHIYMPKKSWLESLPQVFINLYRPSDLEKVFISNGFEFLKCDNQLLSQELELDKVHGDYKNYGKEELSIASTNFILKKPGRQSPITSLMEYFGRLDFFEGRNPYAL